MSEAWKWYRVERGDQVPECLFVTPAWAEQRAAMSDVTRVVELVDGPEVKPPPPKDTFADVLQRMAGWQIWHGLEGGRQAKNDLAWVQRVGRAALELEQLGFTHMEREYDALCRAVRGKA